MGFLPVSTHSYTLRTNRVNLDIYGLPSAGLVVVPKQNFESDMTLYCYFFQNCIMVALYLIGQMLIY